MGNAEADPAPTTVAQITNPEEFKKVLRMGLPRYYFNGFAIAQGASDVTFVLQLNDEPAVILHASLETAKSLSEKISKGIKEFERQIGAELQTIDSVQALVKSRTQKQP